MDFIFSNEILSTIFYAVYGMVLMFIGFKFFDIITPYNFVEEMKEKNPAIGAVIAGIFISVGIIIRAAII
jgi:putative membrane protein